VNSFIKGVYMYKSLQRLWPFEVSHLD